MTNPQDNFIQEAVREAHIKWLAKAETAKINGSEMTVLPYGYLSQAITETLEAQKSHIKEALLAQIPDGKNEDHFCSFNDGAQSCDCYHEARKEDRALINNL